MQRSMGRSATPHSVSISRSPSANASPDTRFVAAGFDVGKTRRHGEVPRCANASSDGGDHLCAIPGQEIAPLALRLVDAAGHRRDGAPQLGGVRSRDQEPHSLRPASITIVSRARAAMMRLRRGKEPPLARSPRGCSESSKPCSRISAWEPSIGNGIDEIDTSAEHGDSLPIGGERGAVRRGVDATGHPTDNAGSGASERAGNRAGDSLAIARGATSANDGDRCICFEKFGIAECPEHRWWVGVVIERAGVKLIATVKELCPRTGGAFLRTISSV